MKTIAAWLGALAVYILVSLLASLLLAVVAYFGLQLANTYDNQIPTFSFWGLYWLIFVVRIVCTDGSSAKE